MTRLQFRAIISTCALLAVFALAGCGKTGALYLPDAETPPAAQPAPATTNPVSPTE